MATPLQTILTGILVVALVTASSLAFWLHGELDRTRTERDIAQAQSAQLAADLQEAEQRIAELEAQAPDDGGVLPGWLEDLIDEFLGADDAGGFPQASSGT